MALANQKCIPCTNETPPLDEAVRGQYLDALPEWKINTKGELERTFTFPDFSRALFFVNEIGRIAEEENHHPDLELSWGKVVVHLITHAQKRLTSNDFIMAAKIDLIKNY